MKLIIAGSRGFFDLKRVRKEIEEKLSDQVTEVVSGGARGADRAGECWAQEKGIPITLFKADWDTWGKAAGFIRNQKMADYGDVLFAFWDGESRGTKHMIETMEKKGKKVFVCKYKEQDFGY